MRIAILISIIVMTAIIYLRENDHFDSKSDFAVTLGDGANITWRYEGLNKDGDGVWGLNADDMKKHRRYEKQLDDKYRKIREGEQG